MIECSNDTKSLERLRKKVDTEFSGRDLEKIQLREPEALFLFLDTQTAKQASSETRVKGYRVKVEYEAISESEMARKREAVTKSVVRSIKGKKK